MIKNKLSHLTTTTTTAKLSYTPEFNKILDRRERNVNTIQYRIEQEQEKKLVVAKSNAIVHPGTMVIL